MTTPSVPTEIRLQTPDGEMVFRRPESAALRYDVQAIDRLSQRAGAALGVCWRERRRPAAKLRADLNAYGAAVFDELAARGWDGNEIADAAIAIWPLITGRPNKVADDDTDTEATDPAEPDPAEVEHARGFTPPTEGGG